MNRAARRTVQSMILGATLAVAGSALASTPVPGELLHDLGSPDHATRARAAEQIAGRSDLKLKDLDEALLRPGLDPEVFVRLVQTAKGKFETSPRAAMGVSFDAMSGLPNLVQKPLETFPSVKVLKPGDRLIEIDGWQLQSRQLDPWSGGSARPFIISHDPGDVVPVKLVRDGELITVQLELGRFADLRNGVPLTETEIGAGWEVRRDRYARGLPTVRGPEVDPGPSVSDEDYQRALEAYRGDMIPINAGGQSITGRTIESMTERMSRRSERGSFRDAWDPANQPQALIRGGEVIINGRRVRNGEVVGGVRVQINPGGEALRQMQQEQARMQAAARAQLARARLELEIDAISVQIDEIDGKLTREEPDAATRAALEQMKRSLQRKLDGLKRERDGLDKPAQP